MDNNDSRIYSEVLGVLLALGDDYYGRIPSNVTDFLKENCDHEYLPDYDRDTRIEDLDISDEARMFLIFLKMKYWCKDEAEKNELKKVLKDNETKFNSEMREKYNPDNIFKEEKETNNTNDKLIKEEKQNWFKKFLSKIKNLFKKRD